MSIHSPTCVVFIKVCHPTFPLSHSNKLRWYPQQPQRFIFTNLSEACYEAKRWKHLSWVSVSYGKWLQIPLNLTWLCTKASQTFFGTLLNLIWQLSLTTGASGRYPKFSKAASQLASFCETSSSPPLASSPPPSASQRMNDFSPLGI